MLVIEPATIAAWPADRTNSGYLQNRYSIFKHALEFLGAEPGGDDIMAAAQFIEAATGIALNDNQLWRLLDLYPYAKAKLADCGWGDTELEGIVLDVVSHAFLGSRWPLAEEQCDKEAFLVQLRLAAAKCVVLLK